MTNNYVFILDFNYIHIVRYDTCVTDYFDAIKCLYEIVFQTNDCMPRIRLFYQVLPYVSSLKYKLVVRPMAQYWFCCVRPGKKRSHVPNVAYETHYVMSRTC